MLLLEEMQYYPCYNYEALSPGFDAERFRENQQEPPGMGALSSLAASSFSAAPPARRAATPVPPQPTWPAQPAHPAGPFSPATLQKVLEIGEARLPADPRETKRTVEETLALQMERHSRRELLAMRPRQSAQAVSGIFFHHLSSTA